MANYKNQDTLGLDSLLEEKNKEYDHKIDFLGSTLLSFPQYTSATRLTMYVNHMKQFNTLINPEFPRVFGGYENTFGRKSSAIVRSDDDYEVIERVEKFEDYPGHIFALFLYNKEKDFYDVRVKRISEELTENYGFLYNNEHFNSLNKGDWIEKGEVLYKSTSFDKDNNYRFGKNALVGVMLHPFNIEDAYFVRKGFAKDMVSIKNDSVFFGVNDNDFLLNLYGDSEIYKSFPDIGEPIKNRIVAAKRRIINDQILYDMKKSNMMKLQPLSDKPFLSTGGIVVDIDIYSNKQIEEIPDTVYNQQVLYYLRNQLRYQNECLEICEKIVSSGSKYSDDIGYMTARLRHILDPDYVWRNNDSEYSNFMIDIKLVRDIPVNIGSKITGRYGDKGVVSKMVDDEKMPYIILPNGERRPLDVIVNPLSCPNRLNPFQWIEMSINHSSNVIAYRLEHDMKTNKERFDYLMKYLKYFNEYGEADKVRKGYAKLKTKKQQDKFWQNIYDYGIFVNYPPMWDDMPAIEKIERIRKEFNIEREQVYVDKWGRTIPIMNKLIVGEKYMLKLKQTSEKNFSARSTGFLSQKGVPEKSNKVKTNEILHSNTPIAIGRDENNNLGIGVHQFILAKQHLFYRNSPMARRETGKLYVTNPLTKKKFKVKRKFLNRNVEILNAELKSLGLEIKFPFDGERLWVDTGTTNYYNWKGQTYLVTKTKMREIIIEHTLRMNFNQRVNAKKFTPEQLEEKYQKFKRKVKYRMAGKTVLDVENDFD